MSFNLFSRKESVDINKPPDNLRWAASMMEFWARLGIGALGIVGAGIWANVVTVVDLKYKVTAVEEYRMEKTSVDATQNKDIAELKQGIVRQATLLEQILREVRYNSERFDNSLRGGK